MKIQSPLDILFTWIPITFSLFWLSQTITTIILTNNLYGGTILFLFGSIHSLTAISVCIMYLVLYFFTNTHLPTPMRVVTASTFIMCGNMFSGVVWSTLNLLIGSKTGMPQLNFAFFFIGCVFLYWLHKKYKIIQIHKKFLVVCGILTIFSVYLLISSNFFYNWSLHELGLYPDPHNWEWGLEQFFILWLWLGVVKNDRDF